MTEPSTATDELTARCAIAGGGPAGTMLGLSLARAGVDVIVLEKHADFLRDFRDGPTRVTQRAQLVLPARLVGRVLDGGPPSARALALIERWPALQRIAARLIGRGVRPEHVAAWRRARRPRDDTPRRSDRHRTRSRRLSRLKDPHRTGETPHESRHHSLKFRRDLLVDSKLDRHYQHQS